MCTAITYNSKDFYFGRTLDYEHTFGEQIVITPRNFKFNFSENPHFSIIGMAHVCDEYPLYYDAMNEKGLCIAGLNFVGNAHYFEAVPNRNNVAQFELIPWLLTRCATVDEVVYECEKINITPDAFNSKLPVAHLHWLVADKKRAITLESVCGGLKIYENYVGVLTNNPPFDMQMTYLNNFINLSPRPPQNRFSKEVDLSPYSRGMGAIGLPGDLSSSSRFVRAAFTKLNSPKFDSEDKSVSQFFHIMNSVAQVEGCCEVSYREYEKTIYTSCLNADKCIYYYTTYDNQRITAVDMMRTNLDDNALKKYTLFADMDVKRQN